MLDYFTIHTILILEVILNHWCTFQSSSSSNLRPSPYFLFRYFISIPWRLSRSSTMICLLHPYPSPFDTVVLVPGLSSSFLCNIYTTDTVVMLQKRPCFWNDNIPKIMSGDTSSCAVRIMDLCFKCLGKPQFSCSFLTNIFLLSSDKNSSMFLSLALHSLTSPTMSIEITLRKWTVFGQQLSRMVASAQFPLISFMNNRIKALFATSTLLPCFLSLQWLQIWHYPSLLH